MARKAAQVKVMRTDGSVSVYDDYRQAAKHEGVHPITVRKIIGCGYNKHGDKYEYVR
jgi:hypothetical protein